MKALDNLGIEAVGIALGHDLVDNRARGETLGFDGAFLTDKIGFQSLCMAAGESVTADLAREAIDALQTKAGFDLDQLDCLVVCTQNPDGHGLPNTASVLHGMLNLPTGCAAFDISLGCSGYVYGLSVVHGFMAANGMRSGILVTADPYSRIVDPMDRATSPLFGDGATATLMSAGGKWKLGKSRFGSDGRQRDAIAVTPSGRLSMNGRQVFAFAATVVPPLVRETLVLNGLSQDDVDLFLMHQGSRYIVEELQRRLQLDEIRLPFGAAHTGNLVSSSIPALLEAGLDSSAKHILLAGFGVGLSWGATVVSRQ